jgi:hypothetical protein
MPGFVIEYHRQSGARRVESFAGVGGANAALRRRLELERERQDPDIEIVSLNGASLEQVMSTHSRYFQGSEVPLAS